MKLLFVVGCQMPGRPNYSGITVGSILVVPHDCAPQIPVPCWSGYLDHGPNRALLKHQKSGRVFLILTLL
jgi:hypothetical protein